MKIVVEAALPAKKDPSYDATDAGERGPQRDAAVAHASEFSSDYFEYIADMILELKYMADKAGDRPLAAQLAAAHVTACRHREGQL